MLVMNIKVKKVIHNMLITWGLLYKNGMVVDKNVYNSCGLWIIKKGLNYSILRFYQQLIHKILGLHKDNIHKKSTICG